MSLTVEQQNEIRRRNGRMSRGPTTEEGKARSRQNALKHGLRAEVLPLPHEDPDAVRARQRAWQDYYQPRSPAAQHLVDQCVQATLLSDRCHTFHAAALSQQIRTAEERWEHGRRDEVERLKALLVEDPGQAVRLLKRSGHGCRWLIARWEELDERLAQEGFWQQDERDEAIRLLGDHPEPEPDGKQSPALRRIHGVPESERSRYSAAAFTIHLLGLACQPDPPAADLKRLREPWRVPHVIRTGYRLDTLPEASLAREKLREIVARQLSALRPEEARLRETNDEPDRAEAVHRALTLRDPAEARLFLRYHAEARTSFHRAYRELVKVLEIDKSSGVMAISTDDLGAPDSLAVVSPNEPDEDASVSPNEPDEDASASPNEPEPASPSEAGTDESARLLRECLPACPGGNGSEASRVSLPTTIEEVTVDFLLDHLHNPDVREWLLKLKEAGRGEAPLVAQILEHFGMDSDPSVDP